jgi:hypothetical protein
MADVTLLRRVEVIRVLPDGFNTVVAGTAGPQHLAVIDRQDRGKRIGRVAVLTDVRRVDV